MSRIEDWWKVTIADMTQKEVATQYARLLPFNEAPWIEINAAIISRWNMAGLKRIKKLAWTLAR